MRHETYCREGASRLAKAVSCELVNRRADPSLIKRAGWELAFDVVLRTEDLETSIDALRRIHSNQNSRFSEFLPIRFVPQKTPSGADRIMAAFDALVLSKATRRSIDFANISYGSKRAETKVNVRTLSRQLSKIIQNITALLASDSPPTLTLNRHCPECEFQSSCRKEAMEKDDLSLLSGLTDKDKVTLNGRGIFTVSQLSYTFRPRRRTKRLAAKPEKYHHSLKALAIREQKIYIVGNPQLQIIGTPVFFDVESLPDLDFFYLIGVRFENQTDGVRHHSLWADNPSDEKRVWYDFLELLTSIGNPVLIHYGSFETKFLKKMCDRYGGPAQGSAASSAIAGSVNLLSAIFAQVYFPSYSNGLKENARFLGFEWSEASSSGLQSIVWRNLWEETQDPVFRAKLVAYNSEDCAALGLVTRVINQIAEAPNTVDEAQRLTPSTVRVDSLKRYQKSKWSPFKSSIPDLEKINLAARWDYQRDRVFVRSGTSKRREPRRSKTSKPARQASSVDKTVILQVSRTCPSCKKQSPLRSRLLSRTVHDLIFGKHSVKQRIVRYVAQTYRCRSCGNEYGFTELRLHGMNWGWNIVAYFVYNAVSLNIPQLTVQHSVNRLFGCNISRSSLNSFKIKASEHYAETKRGILNRIISGNIVHADETSANIRGHLAYVWVFASLKEVVYFIADNREGEIAQGFLKNFRGVLISDFYSAYDSIECPQQKCLIHLMRDLNDEILNNPFDEEVKSITVGFGALLKPIVDTIDRRGLKKKFLQRHMIDVDKFFGRLRDSEPKSDMAVKLKQRFEKNKDKLFTFLEYDDVPWNNNNAEHAIKAFARLRDVLSGLSTKKGIDEFLTLLSVSETCIYRGIDVLDFLRSGEKDIEAFAASRQN